MELLCPVCQTALAQQDRRWVCTNNHCFDVAKEGYLNLLLAQQKRSRQPGDDRTMIQSRRDFLNRGHYFPFSEAINQLAEPQLSKIDEPTIIDVGCGEGYYTSQLFNHFAQQQTSVDICGIDIAKDAVRLAAKRNREIRWLVASARQLPVEDSSTDLLLSLFSPLHREEFLRVLKPRAAVLVAGAGQKHLIELRERLYSTVDQSVFDPLLQLGEQFEEVRSEELRFSLELPKEDLAKLLMMTPHHWRAEPSRKETLVAEESFTVTAEIALRLYRKLAP